MIVTGRTAWRAGLWDAYQRQGRAPMA